MEDHEHTHTESSAAQYHLEYLDQFLKLKCAPDLIAMGLFPNAKEITESFAIWTAVRQYILPQLSTSSPSSSTNNRSNAIIVVGDGITPRTAALCAFLSKGSWQCFSIDPILQYDTYADMTFLPRRGLTTIEHIEQWKTIQGLRMVRAKIQSVSIQCRQAIIVMMHAHVSIEDAIAAIDASEGIVGLVTCPCCKWTPMQQEYLGQAPHHQYVDIRLLSAKNQMNIWCFPQGEFSKSTRDDHQHLRERNTWGVETSMIENIRSNRDGVKQRARDLWQDVFSNGIRAFNSTEIEQSSNDSDIWPWGSTTWSPRDVLPLIKSCNDTISTDPSILPSWFNKPVLLIGTIGAMRRCKHTIFYELNSCSFALTHASNETFPEFLKSANRIWTYIEYQEHRQAVTSFDLTAERKTKKRNEKETTDSLSIDRVKIVLSLLSYESITKSIPDELTSISTDEKEYEKRKIFNQNPQPRETLFPWIISLRPGDILVAYCQLGRNGTHGPILCLIDGILLFDSKLHIFGVDRRILR